MEFIYRLTIWECIVCGIRRASKRLFHIPSEIIGIYKRCGKQERTVRIEDGSIFVIGETDTREYLCRNIRGFQKKGGIYWFVMTGRAGMEVQLYLPVRVVGDGQAQKDFWEYVNDQRRISGDKLVLRGAFTWFPPAGAGGKAENEPGGERGEVQHILQKWNLDKLSQAAAECLWIKYHCMKEKWWKNWAVRRLPYMLACLAVYMVLWQVLRMQTIPICLALFAMLGFWTSQELEHMEKISMKEIRGQMEKCGSEIYEEEWKLSIAADWIKRRAPYLENVWGWESVGEVIETDAFYFFFDRRQDLMFYVEKVLFGEWLVQKLFVQRCQERGIRYQCVQPKIVADRDAADGDMPLEEASGEGTQREGTPREGSPRKILPIGDAVKEREKNLGRKAGRQSAGTQEGWREFWAKKEKERRKSDKIQVILALSGIAVLIVLAFVLPEYGGRGELAATPVMMDQPMAGDPYVFHPESYKDYTPLEEQVEVLKTLGFEITEDAVAGLRAGMEEEPMARVWVEGDPYRSLLSMLGMPKRNYDTWEMEEYSDQAYWFDWEGFDMSQEYVYILNAVNAMAKGEFTITDARQEMSDADWEKGSGVVHLSFNVNEIPFEYEMKLESDWLDTKIIGDINDALKKAGIEKQVYAMADDGQGCILMYGDKDWAKRFRKATGIRLETE